MKRGRRPSPAQIRAAQTLFTPRRALSAAPHAPAQVETLGAPAIPATLDGRVARKLRNEEGANVG